MVDIRCLRATITSGGQEFPILIGFLPARDILRVAEVPSFSIATDHSAIARNVLNPPIRDWQRPLDPTRVQAIQHAFDDSGNIMPNPVLLSENALSGATASIRQESGPNGITTNSWIVSVPEPGEGRKPLWILDGQHRINGLAGSAQADNSVPLVLLMNLGIDSYQPQTFAKLFAQVTTSATPLEPLHHEWLTYAFRLLSYANAEPSARDHRDAMATVAALCEEQTLGGQGGQANPFFNQVRFNPHATGGVRPAGGGFVYDCRELKEIVRTEYFGLTGVGARLAPTSVAWEIGKAYVALQQVVTGSHEETVFFGAGDRGQKPMQDAFMVGVLAHLRARGAPNDWRDVLTDLAFPGTDWNFQTWVGSTGGRAGNLAKKIAWKVFRTVFAEARLPGGSATLADFLQGNNAVVTLEASHLTPQARPARADRLRIEVTPGVQNPSVGPRRHIRIVGLSDNIGALTVLDAQAPLAGRFSFAALRRGVVVDDHGPNPVRLLFKMEHYGATEQQAQVGIRWQ